MAGYKIIFHKVRTPLFVQVHPDDEDHPGSAKPGREDEIQTRVIKPGPNKVDEDLWEYLQQKESVQKRIEDGVLYELPNTNSLKSHLAQLRGPVDRGLISTLCAKSQAVDDEGLVFDGEGATSIGGQIRKTEDQLEEIKNSLPVVGG